MLTCKIQIMRRKRVILIKKGVVTKSIPNYKVSQKGSDACYKFKSQLGREILKIVRENEIQKRSKNNWEMEEILKNLEESDQFIVINDKMNSFMIVTKINKYYYG